jgi:hypothetical protein
MTKSLSLSNHYVAELEAIVSENGWDLKKNFRSYWCSFSVKSRLVAFGIAVDSSNTPYLYIKRVQSESNGFPARLLRYNEADDQAEFSLEPGVSIKSFLPLLRLAYSRILK